MQNNFNNMEVPYRMSTPLGFASSSSNLAGMNYSPSTNHSTTPTHQGFPLNKFNSYSSPAAMYAQVPVQPQQFGSNPMVFNNMHNMSHVNSPNMVPQAMMPNMGKPFQPPPFTSLWNYLDDQNNVQGPFLSSQMDHWLSSGFFKSDLKICVAPNKLANPFDDPNVNLTYPCNIKTNEYITLEQFCKQTNSNINSPIFQNFDQLSNMMMRDFFSQKLPSGPSQNFPMPRPSIPKEMAQPTSHNTTVSSPLVTSSSIASAGSEKEKESVSKYEENFETKNSISIESMREILANNEQKRNQFADSFSSPPEKTKMSFREALALKPPKHPLAYTHKDKREIAFPATKNILTRQGKYNPNYYIKSNYNYEELLNIGMKDESGSECTYSEYISYLSVGKIEDNVIESDEWPEEFFESENNIENKLSVTYKKFTSLTSPEDIPEVEELRKYFAAVNETTISQLVDADGESHPLEVKDHVKILFERFTNAMNNNSLEIDGSILAYLSRVSNETLKSLVVVFRIIFDSKVEKFSKSYDAVAVSFIALFPKAYIVFNKNRSVYDLPFDDNIVILLELFIRSITLSDKISTEFMNKAIEIVQFLKKKSIRMKSYPVLEAFIKTNEFKKAKIDLLINEIEDSNKHSMVKSANQAKLVSFLWSKIQLNSYDQNIRIQAYKFKFDNEDLSIFEDLNRDAPVFKWTSSVTEKKDIFQVPEVSTNSLLNATLDSPSEITSSKFNESNKETVQPVTKEEKKTTLPHTSEKTSVMSTSVESRSDKTKTVQSSLKANFSWEKKSEKPQSSSIADMIQKRKEEEKKKAEEAKAAKLIFEPPKSNIVEALKNLKTDTKTAKTSGSGNPWINDDLKKNGTIIDELKNVEKKKSSPEPEFDNKFIEEQKKLLETIEIKKRQEDAKWVTVDKSKTSQITAKNVWEDVNSKPANSSALHSVGKVTVSKESKPLIDSNYKIPVVEKSKKTVMPDTYLSSAVPPVKSNKALLEASQKASKTKSKAEELEFDSKFIEEQKKLFEQMEMKKKELEASWVTVDKSKQQAKQKKTPVVFNSVTSANLNPDKLRKIQSQPVTKSSSSIKTSKPSPNVKGNSSMIPSGTQKEFITWCEKNLGNAEFLKILFSIERSNAEFFVDMVNSSGMNTKPVDKKVANEFFEIKNKFENSPKFLYWIEAIDTLHDEDDGWSFQTVKKK
ncbi:uncharacterized protein HGUI_03194 [Hanseniaspora guilliermondii]|uniref:GYF domain-containing protein n=1 Tax=Hanseniaspora guilliermondii TaxID=56406 RepID=A0A1L0B3N7_9ASCO|nr:uncharacterized protein HGUI_03194 [Hanseniaspora guilliermondii]